MNFNPNYAVDLVGKQNFSMNSGLTEIFEQGIVNYVLSQFEQSSRVNDQKLIKCLNWKKNKVEWICTV
ncbi:hypothetical protein FUMI01_18930 [Flavobacterium sp. UMI-01]|nr:hypothetical protein FUMI01_18930 [Flavobacterium sp. UMI-01]